MSEANDRIPGPPPPPRLPQPVAPNGRFRSPHNQPDRDSWAVDMFRRGESYRGIAQGLEINVSSAYESVQRGLREARALDQEIATNAREMQRARLERAHEAAMAVLHAEHITVSNGRVVLLDEETITDHDPVLRAIDRVVKISESIRRLDGLDAATKVDATVSISAQDAELQERLRVARERVAEQERRMRDGDGEA